MRRAELDRAIEVLEKSDLTWLHFDFLLSRFYATMRNVEGVIEIERSPKLDPAVAVKVDDLAASLRKRGLSVRFVPPS